MWDRKRKMYITRIIGLPLGVFGRHRCSATGASLISVPGYVLKDGSIRVVGVRSMQDIIERLNALYVARHPGVRFRYVPADNNSSISAFVE